jgi:hypothetical protein
MPLNKLYSQVFYNMLISPLAEIKDLVEQGNYNDAKFQALIMLPKLEVNDWHPFPAYQNFLTRLQIKEQVSQLFVKLADLTDGKDIEANKTFVVKTLLILNAYAHFLNLLDNAYTDSKKTVATILHNTGKELGIFGKVPTQTYDCNLNLRFVSPSNTQTQAIPATLAYDEIIAACPVDNARLGNFCQTLFATMDEIAKDNGEDDDNDEIEKNDTTAAKLKGDEQDMFKLGFIERLITISNTYKKEFKELTAEFNASGNQLEPCPAVYKALNDFFST